MKKFISLSASLVSLIILIIVGIVLIINFYVDGKSNFKINRTTKYLVVGHSHPECAFNDSLISNLSNYGRSGEANFYTYLKTKKLLEQNTEIETVFVEFTNNQVSKNMDDWTWDDAHLSVYPVYAPFMGFTDNKLICINNFSGFRNGVSVSVNKNFERIQTKDFNYLDEIGGYYYLVRNFADSMMIKRPDTNNNDLEEVSWTNIAYLEKIVALCQGMKKQVFLVRSPMHENYRGMGNEGIFKDILNTRFPSVEFLDLKTLPFTTSEFGDLEHLNFRGSRKFSLWFDSLIKGGLLTQTDKQGFINARSADLLK